VLKWDSAGHGDYLLGHSSSGYSAILSENAYEATVELTSYANYARGCWYRGVSAEIDGRA
jgi:hypothetical protein